MYTAKREGLNLTASVVIEAAVFDKKRQEAIKELGKEVTVAGFRKGQAPENLIEARLDQNKILDKALSSLLPDILKEILEKEKFTPLTYPQINLTKVAPGNDLEFSLMFVLPPEVKLGDYKSIRVKKAQVEPVSEEKIDQSIANIFEAKKKEGSTKSEPVIYGADGQPISSKSPSLELNDEFAKSLGANDLAHLRELVKADLEEIALTEAERKFETDLFKELTAMSSVEVPDILVEDELNRMISRAQTDLSRSGIKFEDYLKESQKTIEQLMQDWRPQARNNVQVQLILGEVGKAEEVEISDEELEAAMSETDPSKLDDKTRTDLENFTRYAIFQTKTLKILKDIALSKPVVKKDKTAKK